MGLVGTDQQNWSEFKFGAYVTRSLTLSYLNERVRNPREDASCIYILASKRDPAGNKDLLVSGRVLLCSCLKSDGDRRDHANPAHLTGSPETGHLFKNTKKTLVKITNILQ